MAVDSTEAYKAEIAELYSSRSSTYDNSAWHNRIARRLVDYSNLKPDSRVLDIATGTGIVAFYAAEIMNQTGSVTGVDISEGMIAVAKEKLTKSEMMNVSFEVGDGEALKFEPDSFDFIFCSSAFIWMTDLSAALNHWRTCLRRRGKLGFHAFSGEAFVTGAVAQSVLQNYGIDYSMSKATGTSEKCRALLEKAGYRNINIIEDKNGVFISLEDAKNTWVSASHPAPGQFPHPLKGVSPEILAKAREDYEKEIEKMNTENGVWNDMSTFYVYGEK